MNVARTSARLVEAAGLLTAALALTAINLACSGAPLPVSTAERDFCQARAAYKLAALAANGALDPAPGSPRAKLEAAEDRFCSAHADGGS